MIAPARVDGYAAYPNSDIKHDERTPPIRSLGDRKAMIGNPFDQGLDVVAAWIEPLAGQRPSKPPVV